jgi:hypothetical protein
VSNGKASPFIYSLQVTLLGPTSLPGILFFLYYFPVGPTSLLGYSSTVQWSSFDFLESSSLRKVVQEGIPPAATKHQQEIVVKLQVSVKFTWKMIKTCNFFTQSSPSRLL